MFLDALQKIMANAHKSNSCDKDYLPSVSKIKSECKVTETIPHMVIFPGLRLLKLFLDRILFFCRMLPRTLPQREICEVRKNLLVLSTYAKPASQQD